MKGKICKAKKNSKMFKSGWKACIKWADGSKGYYKNKRDAKSELKREKEYS